MEQLSAGGLPVLPGNPYKTTTGGHRSSGREKGPQFSSSPGFPEARQVPQTPPLCRLCRFTPKSKFCSHFYSPQKQLQVFCRAPEAQVKTLNQAI